MPVLQKQTIMQKEKDKERDISQLNLKGKNFVLPQLNDKNQQKKKR